MARKKAIWSSDLDSLNPGVSHIGKLGISVMVSDEASAAMSIARDDGLDLLIEIMEHVVLNEPWVVMRLFPSSDARRLRD